MKLTEQMFATFQVVVGLTDGRYRDRMRAGLQAVVQDIPEPQEEPRRFTDAYEHDCPLECEGGKSDCHYVLRKSRFTPQEIVTLEAVFKVLDDKGNDLADDVRAMLTESEVKE